MRGERNKNYHEITFVWLANTLHSHRILAADPPAISPSCRMGAEKLEGGDAEYVVEGAVDLPGCDSGGRG